MGGLIARIPMRCYSLGAEKLFQIWIFLLDHSYILRMYCKSNVSILAATLYDSIIGDEKQCTNRTSQNDAFKYVRYLSRTLDNNERWNAFPSSNQLLGYTDDIIIISTLIIHPNQKSSPTFFIQSSTEHHHLHSR